jgi:hypothetical protein
LREELEEPLLYKSLYYFPVEVVDGLLIVAVDVVEIVYEHMYISIE